ncbi:Hypothetical_protein [Hexamita inflata]|uniref:Hypothetical_protein n=1 Tax=Hexamita inflata TaxID=28002 RepID=A0AA86QYQ8_9EUKA|nr:Hypothetical protein HINF_LOCUS49958 [Hexamita inflata]
MMRPVHSRMSTSYKLETIQESDNEASETSINSMWIDGRTGKSSANLISTIGLDTFVSLSRREFYEIQCTLEYLDFCELELNKQIGQLGRIVSKSKKLLEAELSK